VAFTRYADEVDDPAVRHLYQFPKGKPYRFINAAELYKIQKPKEHWDNVKRSKSYLADKFFAPFDLKEGNLRELFYEQKETYLNADKDQEKFNEWRQRLLEVIPKLNHDVLVQLSLHLAYDAKINDKEVWKAIENAAYESLH
jgi:hypothetical protein